MHGLNLLNASSCLPTDRLHVRDVRENEWHCVAGTEIPSATMSQVQHYSGCLKHSCRRHTISADTSAEPQRIFEVVQGLLGTILHFSRCKSKFCYFG